MSVKLDFRKYLGLLFVKGCFRFAGMRLSENYGLDFQVFYHVRELRDGFTFLNFLVNWDRYLDDHKPSMEFEIVVCNWVIVRLEIYYLFHRDD
jgi:hypothetical protein